jgi:hypothetical protein
VTGNQVQRYLRTEELYREIIDMVCPDVLKEIGESGVRGKLDALISKGKIEGRLSAYNDGRVFGGILPEHDRLIERWQRIVDAADQAPSDHAPKAGDEVFFPDRVEVIGEVSDDGIWMVGNSWVYRSRLAPIGPGRWRFKVGA